MFLQEYLEDWFANGTACLYYIFPLLLIISWRLILWLSSSKLKLPPGPIGLPLLGYLLFLGKDPHRTLDNLMKKYGKVMSLYLGQTYVVILGDDQAVREAFGKATTADRPPHLFSFLPDGGGLSALNGIAWVEQRRFTVRTMKDLGLGGSTWGRLVEEEVTEFLALLKSKKGSPIEISELLMPSVTNNISSLVFGERLPPGPDKDSLNKYMKTLIKFIASASVSFFFPWLHKLLVKLRISSAYRIQSEIVGLNSILRKRVDFHKKTRGDSRGANFIDEYIDVLKANEDKSTYFTEGNMVANTANLYIGGSDTVITLLSWLFLIMADFPYVQEKVHSEVVSVSGTQSRPSWEDRLKFPYSYAVILEALRWQPIVPLNVARMASEDTEVCGYVIPKGTTIFANFWSLMKDPKYWPEPEIFRPERFLQNGGKDVNVKLGSYFPFSYGKRNCPGETVAMIEVFTFFTSTVQMFEIRTPIGMKVNFEGTLAATYQPTPQKLCYIPRQKIH